MVNIHDIPYTSMLKFNFAFVKSMFDPMLVSPSSMDISDRGFNRFNQDFFGPQAMSRRHQDFTQWSEATSKLPISLRLFGGSSWLPNLGHGAQPALTIWILCSIWFRDTVSTSLRPIPFQSQVSHETVNVGYSEDFLLRVWIGLC